MSLTVLAGDIGGTKTILRLISADAGGPGHSGPLLTTLWEMTYVSNSFSDLVPMVHQFFRDAAMASVSVSAVDSACFGIAGPNFFGNGGVLAFGLLAGCLGISGIVLRNTIMLYSHCQYLQEQGGMSFGPELVAQGARERLSPTLITALATGLALLPFVLLGNIPGHEIVRPVAIVTIGGLFTSTWLNLFAMPVLYLRLGASREADLRFERADQPVVATD